MEIWKTCPGLCDYEISNHGRIRNSWDGYILKPYIGSHGQQQVIVRDRGVRRCIYIHRSVAEAFIPCDVTNGMVIHNDKNKLNNHVDNLRWVNKQEYFRDLYKQEKYNNDHFKKKIRCVETGEIFGSIGEASDMLNIGYRSISRCVNNPYTQTKEGYHFEMVD